MTRTVTRKGVQARLTSRIRNSSTMAPKVATMRLGRMPPPGNKPSRRKRKPPRKAPTTPTTKSPRRPKPLPLVIFPANQPAMMPMMRKPIKLMVFPLGQVQLAAGKFPGLIRRSLEAVAVNRKHDHSIVPATWLKARSARRA
ncbi:hypothetical protein THIX_110049 [Thiomonas sp. X19]|nr:hypothetical protein THIX_110049 [Thiomonas sp. X19]